MTPSVICFRLQISSVQVLRVLLKLLEASRESRTLAVAASDLGYFITYNPHGRNIVAGEHFFSKQSSQWTSHLLHLQGVNKNMTLLVCCDNVICGPCRSPRQGIGDALDDAPRRRSAEASTACCSEDFVSQG